MPLHDEAEEAREPLILRKARTRERAQGMSRPLLKLGGGAVEILRDVLH